MAKKNRYRWQNEKRHAREEKKRAWLEAEMKHRSSSGKTNPAWGSMLRYYELVSMHPLKYRRVR